jgi:hypothetical protein
VDSGQRSFTVDNGEPNVSLYNGLYSVSPDNGQPSVSVGSAEHIVACTVQRVVFRNLCVEAHHCISRCATGATHE